jgi:hypothetical protein
MGCACGWRFRGTEAGADEEEDLRREGLGRRRKNCFVIFLFFWGRGIGRLLISLGRIIYKNQTKPNPTELNRTGRAFSVGNIFFGAYTDIDYSEMSVLSITSFTSYYINPPNLEISSLFLCNPLSHSH